MINIFSRATNLRNIPAPSTYHVFITMLVIIALQIAAIAYLVDMRVQCVAAVLNAIFAAYQGVRNG